MDLGQLIEETVQSLTGNGRQPGQLGRKLEQVRQRTHQLVSGGANRSSILAQLTLAAARVLATNASIREGERETMLATLHEVLNSDRLRQTHSAVAEHLARVLPQQFSMDASVGIGAAEHSRALAVYCFHRLLVIPEVYVADRSGGQFVSMQRWYAVRTAGAKASAQLAFAACGLLDNAECAADSHVRSAALETLTLLLAKDGALGDAQRLGLIFPGVASALSRIALVQPPPQSMVTEPPRKPPAVVRALAICALQAALITMFGRAKAPQQLEGSTSVAHWAQRAREELHHTTDMDNAEASGGSAKPSESTSDSQPNELQRHVQQMLWRLAGLRHTEGLQTALFELFASASLECSELCDASVQVAIEACVAIGGASNPPQGFAAYGERLLQKRGAAAAQLAVRAQRQFEQHVAGNAHSTEVLRLLGGWLRVPGVPGVEQWWTRSGLPALLQALPVALPGTALLADAPASDAGAAVAVPAHFRAPQSALALDCFVSRLVAAVGPATLGAQLLAALEDSTGVARNGALWLLLQVIRHAESPADLAAISRSAFAYCAEHCTPQQHTAKSIIVDESTQATHTYLVLSLVTAAVPAVGAGAVYSLDTLLFPLLQAAATADIPVVRTQAHAALLALACATGSADVPQMLQTNVDYIVDACARQIRAVELHPHVFDILTSTVQLVGADILRYMDDVVEDSLDVCERSLDETVAVAALRFLEAVTRFDAAARTATLPEKSLPMPAPVGTANDVDPIARAIAEMGDTGTAEEQHTVASPQQHDDASEVGGSALSIKIALATQGFLASEHGSQQLVALKIVDNALQALQGTRDLLPLINQVWPHVVRRLQSGRDVFYVTLAACSLVECACRLGADWMRARVRDDLWPHFVRVLRDARTNPTLAGVSLEAPIRVLAALRTVVEYVPLDDATAWDLAVAACALLTCPRLRDHVLPLLRAMVLAYADKVWLVLAKLGCVEALPPERIPDLGLPSGILQSSLPPDICQSLGL
ncbi:hypothetical protein H4R20_004924 [Coemansia guatemalensis]|uniref:TTI1 C-terminal TPR domain-containing protein n=1 Tax=Coemansia guatemalensis TaxID=2761395 RepID=A0A9W8HQJ7_9FUNG|nr:hypothetical protein H4R20_004924 [Coemansia guatemalensis]